MVLVLATHNVGKVVELRALIPAGFALQSLAEFPAAPHTLEDGDTFETNARKKAVEATQALGLPALADDSGLCVDALGGRPGVNSARYALGDDAARIRKLLGELERVPEAQRTASFQCALALALPGGTVTLVRGELPGRIARAPAGTGGFGYDPVFLLEDGRTLAQLSAPEKDAISHRARAFEKMRPTLKALL